ncbi:MAG: methyltransferase domain-containing protein [Deltaproteobacteria bacterium]|nr:methyltransferase domain-containing protein [Deltaproteobacteria bacterium]
MKPLDEIYKPGFFKRRDSLSWRAPIICGPVIEILRPNSVIDVGCAIGDLVECFLEKGLDAYGLEGTENVIPWLKIPRKRLLYIVDLRTQFDLQRKFDLAMCFEVLEHVEPEHADTLVKNLTDISDRLLISAAPPGQGGHYHVNCQPMAYWNEKFGTLGYRPDAGVVARIRDQLAPWKQKPGVKAIHQNLAYFEKR